MALENTNAGRDPVTEKQQSTDSSQARMAAENQQSQARDDSAIAAQRTADRAEMSKITGSNFQIEDNGKPC